MDRTADGLGVTAHPASVVLRLIDDPAEVGLAGQPPLSTIRFSDERGARRARRVHETGHWLWQTETGAEGTVPTRAWAFTMIAFHCPDLRHLVLDGGDESPGE